MAPESFDATHVTSSCVKSRAEILGTTSYSLKAAHLRFYMGGTHMSGCFFRSNLKLVIQYWGRDHLGEDPPPPLPVSLSMDGLTQLPQHHCSVEGLARPYSSSYSLTALYSLYAPSASAFPTRMTWTLISQRSIYLEMCSLISLFRRTPNLLLSMTWVKTKVILEFQLILRTPRYSTTNMDVIFWYNKSSYPKGIRVHSMGQHGDTNKERRSIFNQ